MDTRYSKIIVFKDENNNWTADFVNITGSPTVGRGESAVEAIGMLLIAHAKDMEIEIKDVTNG